jgi:Fe-S-cluster-containing dehydrogenase component
MRLGMVIDLQRCVGCGACAFACKAENNTRNRADGQSFNWADFVMKTEGVFPNVTHWVMPVLCNHCSDAPCVKACPVKGEKAMYKTPEGITMYDSSKCIGCRSCQEACPYSHETLGEDSLDGATYSVISYNSDERDTQPYWTDKSVAIAGCTSSGAEVAAKCGVELPAMNAFKAAEAMPTRRKDVVEKCTFCYHRVSNGLQPACVEVCPAQARIFGDQEDPATRISQVLASQKSFRLQEDKGTKPNVHYIGKYSARA